MRTNVEHLIGEREVKKERITELKDEVSRVRYENENEEVQIDENLQEKLEEIAKLEEEVKLLDERNS